jgi:hypothetical protein
MTTSPTRWLRSRSARLAVGIFLVGPGLVWSASQASGDSATTTTTALTQSNSTASLGAESVDSFGVTVTGQNGDSVPTGTVTVTDTASGTTICTATLAPLGPPVGGAVSGATCSPSDNQFPEGTAFTTVVATYGGDTSNASSVSSPAQSFAVSSSSPTAVPAAPSGFGASLENTYQSELNTASALGQPTSNVESMSQFDTQVSNLSSAQLAQFYNITQQVPQWSEIPALMGSIAANAQTLPPGTVPANLSSFRVTSSALRAKGSTGRVRSVVRAVLTALDTHQAVLVDQPVGPFIPQQCPAAPPEAAIFAAQIVIDVASSVYNLGSVLGSGQVLGVYGGVGFSIAAIVAEVVVLAASIVHDTLAYLLALANDCANANVAGEVANVDNTTVQTYGLMTQTETLIVQLQATQAKTQQDVENIVNTGLSTFQQTLQQALSSDTSTIQQTTGSDTQGTLTELQVLQTALQGDVATVEKTETTTGQQVVTGVTTLQSTLSADLTQIIHETDSDAQGLTTLVTQGDQQILNTIQSESATTQQQFQSYLKLQIEQALAGFGPLVPEVKFMLPAKYGGYLDSTPVGVQSVVTADLAAMQKIGAPVKPTAVTLLSAGNAALAAGQYTTAFTDFAHAYQALA